MRLINNKLRLALFFLAASISISAQVQAWPGGIVTHSTSAPYPDGNGGMTTSYYNWVYTDTQGISHSFQGQTEHTNSYIDDTGHRIPQLSTTLDVTSDDGQFRLHAMASNGSINGALGIMYPKYQIISIIYAPPGQSSHVDYGVSTTVGTSHSISKILFKQFLRQFRTWSRHWGFWFEQRH